ncbi:hypothetical protein PRIC2_007242 [Phytophthora ramorum]
MAGANSANAPESGRVKAKALGENKDSRAPGGPKKKPHQNGTAKSAPSTTGHATTKKGKTSSSKNGKGIIQLSDTNYDVELQADTQPKALPQKIQVKVKQRSVGGSSTIAASDTTSDANPADTAEFADGHYGMLLVAKRAENLCISLGLRQRHVETLLGAFKHEEQLGTGEIMISEFFTMLHEQPRQLTNGLFEAVGLAREIRRLRFDDFVLCVATIATWSKSELIHYAFKQFDVDKSGLMDGRELRAFCEGLKNDSSFYFAKNVNTAREKLALRDRKQLNNQVSSGQLQIDTNFEDNTLVDIEDLAKGSTEFQVAFYPLMQLQQNVRACALGEKFWSRVAQRRQDVDVVVQYMGLHKGKLPPTSLVTRITAHLVPFSRAHANMLMYKLAILKYAEEQRQRQESARLAKALKLTQVEGWSNSREPL